MKRDKQSKICNFRLTPKENEALTQLARMYGLSRTPVVRTLVICGAIGFGLPDPPPLLFAPEPPDRSRLKGALDHETPNFDAANAPTSSELN
jgi:hypothetical protein